MARRREYWIQIENHPWNARPWGVDRLGNGMHGGHAPTGAGESSHAKLPEALIFRLYTQGWGKPADPLLNPWDLTEPDPAQTLGSIPGAVLEAKVGDEILVHFRNMDMRSGLPLEERIHSLHAHGVQRDAAFDGAYPLSLPDPAQGGKQGDRVAPTETFSYLWTCPHRSSAGVWLFHDHATAHGRADALGAIGVLVIRAPGEQQPNLPAKPVRSAGDTALHFKAVPSPPKRADYLLVFHELEGIGLCLNGRRGLGETPTLIAGQGTRMTLRCLNATPYVLTFHLHGHRWNLGDRWVDSEVLGPGSGVNLSLLADSAQNGGGPGEWMIMGHVEGQMVIGSILVTDGGAISLPTA